MVRMMGALLVASGAAWLGIRAAGALDQEIYGVRGAIEGFALLERELEWDNPSLSELMRRLIPRCSGPTKELFLGVRQGLNRLEEVSLAETWMLLVEEQRGFRARTKEILMPLGGVLGRFSCEEQCKAVSTLLDRLNRLEQELLTERQRKGKLYRVLGVSGGSMLALLLL